MSAANDGPGADIATFSDLHHLLAHQSVRCRVPVSLLCFLEHWEGARQEVPLTISHIPLVGLTPIPEERSQAFQPLEPRGVCASPDGIMSSPHRCLFVWVRADERPLRLVRGPSLHSFVERRWRTICPGLQPLVTRMLRLCQAKKPRRTCRRHWRSANSRKRAMAERTEAVASHPSGGEGFSRPPTEASAVRPSAWRCRGP